jgi:hypothetical protein
LPVNIALMLVLLSQCQFIFKLVVYRNITWASLITTSQPDTTDGLCCHKPLEAEAKPQPSSSLSPAPDPDLPIPAAAMAHADAEAVDFNFDDDDLMDEEVPEPAPAPRLRSAIAGGGGGDGSRMTKGRGFRVDSNSSAPRDSSFAAGGLVSVGGSDPVRCTPLFPHILSCLRVRVESLEDLGGWLKIS